MKTKDLMISLTAEKYLLEIMKIPLSRDSGQPYNRRSEPTCSGACAAHITAEFARWRSLRMKKSRLKRHISELLAFILKAEKETENSPALNIKRAELRDLILMLGETDLRIRELEIKRDEIPCDFIREIISHRYFTDPERRLPTWSETAKELGIAVNGEELRRYVCQKLTSSAV
ncbi:MAG: hypothetical protein Q4E74_02025 [Ruminococcus sp.]|nr:hypothetical protein [Ruminococcus sp.]